MKVCTIDGCDVKHVARGYCGAHYWRWQRYGDATAPPRIRRSMEVIEEVEALGRCSPEVTAARLGMTVGAIATSLRRSGRRDLVTPFYAAEKRVARVSA